MKRKLYVVLLSVLLPLSAFAQKTVHVATAGTLNTLISDEEKYTIQDLTVTGQINGTDLALLRDMAGNNSLGQLTEGQLQVIDLSDAKIVSGGVYLDTDKITYQEGGGIASGDFHFESVAGTIPEWCFYGCNSLKKITLPLSVTAIGKAAFMDLMLEAVTVASEGIKSIGERAFYHDIYMKAFQMPSTVRHIGPNAFAYCDILAEIDIPFGVTEIGKNAFRCCYDMTKVYSHMAKPCAVTEKTFENVAGSATLYVPKGTKSAYEAADVWKDFAVILETDEEPRPATVTVSISEFGKKTFCSDEDLDFSVFNEDVKAYVATGYDPTPSIDGMGGTVWMTRVTDVPAGTGIFLKGTPGDYEIPVNAESSSYYKNMLVATGTEGTIDIPSSTDSYVNLYLTKNDAGTALIFRTIAGEGRTMNPYSAYLQIPKPFKERPETASAENESITLIEGKSTYCSGNDLDFSTMGDALKAYVATGYTGIGGTIWMTRVYDVPAGTGIFLKGENKTHNVPTKVKSTESFYETVLMNMMVGTLEETTIPSKTDAYKNMYLTKEDGVLKFCGIAGESRKMGANKAYLQIPLSVLGTRSDMYEETDCYDIDFIDDVIGVPAMIIDGDVTAISKIAVDSKESVWYNLNGQRVEQPTKGLYITNGRKVIFK